MCLRVAHEVADYSVFRLTHTHSLQGVRGQTAGLPATLVILVLHTALSQAMAPPPCCFSAGFGAFAAIVQNLRSTSVVYLFIHSLILPPGAVRVGPQSHRPALREAAGAAGEPDQRSDTRRHGRTHVACAPSGIVERQDVSG